MTTSKPDLTRVWAEGAPSANVVDPDVTTPGKVASGWQAEVPPFEHFNFLQKWFTQGLAHFNEQGIAVWDSETVYPIAGIAKGSNGALYQSTKEQNGNDPTTDDGTNWTLFEASSDISTLRNIEPVFNGQKIFLLGHTYNGIGSGVFYYDELNTDADDNGKVIVTSGGARWVRETSKINVDMYGADPTGNNDSFSAFQSCMFNNKQIDMSEGTYLLSDVLIIHNKSGFKLTGAGEDSTVLKASTDLTLDTQRIVDLGLADASEYATNALFLITEYDGENDRPLFAARNHQFVGFTVDLEGSPAERIAHAFTSPNNSHSQWKDIKVRYAMSHYYGSVFSDERSRHYHLDWNNCRSVRSVHHCWNGYPSTSLFSIGTTWLYRNNSLVTTDNGYEMLGLNYSAIENSSVDNNKKGSYAIYALDCSGLNIDTPGVETRLEKAGTDFGGAIFKAVGSSITINSGFFVGGDKDEVGSGIITDYDDGSGTVANSLFVLDDSIADITDVTGDWQVGSSSTVLWPWYLENGSVLRYNQGRTNSGDLDSHFDVNDTSYADIKGREGIKDRTLYSSSRIAFATRYETGSFTPKLADASSGGNEATVEVTNGYYTVMGNQCVVNINMDGIDTTGMNASNGLFITDLPFTAISKAGFIRGATDVILNRITFSGNPVAIINDNTDFISLKEVNSGTLESEMLVSQITSNQADIQLTIQYEIVPIH